MPMNQFVCVCVNVSSIVVTMNENNRLENENELHSDNFYVRPHTALALDRSNTYAEMEANMRKKSV